MKNRNYIISIILIALIVFGIYSTNDKKIDVPLKIGVIAPLSGDFAGVGENVVKGMRTAELAYEEKTGNQIELIVENDSADAAKGLSAYKKLTEIDQVKGLLNTFTSTMDAIYEPSKHLSYPVMMEFFQANNVSDDHVFQMTLGNDNVWDRYARYITGAGFNQEKVVVVHSVDAAQDSFAKAFVSEYQKPATILVASSDKNSLRSDAAKIAKLKPTLIIFFMTPENGAVLTKELLPIIDDSVQLAYDIQLFTGLSYYQDQLGGDLSRIDGAINLMFEGDPNSSEYEEFLEAYKKLYPNEDPGFLSDYGYDTLVTYLDTYDEDKTNWIKNLKSNNSKGASGLVKFDQNGIRIVPLVIKKVVDGKLETITQIP